MIKAIDKNTSCSRFADILNEEIVAVSLIAQSVIGKNNQDYHALDLLLLFYRGAVEDAGKLRKLLVMYSDVKAVSDSGFMQKLTHDATKAIYRLRVLSLLMKVSIENRNSYKVLECTDKDFTLKDFVRTRLIAELRDAEEKCLLVLTQSEYLISESLRDTIPFEHAVSMMDVAMEEYIVASKNIAFDLSQAL